MNNYPYGGSCLVSTAHWHSRLRYKECRPQLYSGLPLVHKKHMTQRGHVGQLLVLVRKDFTASASVRDTLVVHFENLDAKYLIIIYLHSAINTRAALARAVVTIYRVVPKIIMQCTLPTTVRTMLASISIQCERCHTEDARSSTQKIVIAKRHTHGIRCRHSEVR